MLDLEAKARLFKALGHPTRLRIYKQVLQMPYVCGIHQGTEGEDLIRQATCVGTIASEFNYSLPTISRHLKELREARLIRMEKIGNKIYVEPDLETLKEISECFEGMLANVNSPAGS